MLLDNTLYLFMNGKSEHCRGNQRRQILAEEEYSSTLQKIITRDYFPSLTSLNRDASILQKRSEGDIAGAVAIRRAAREIAEHEALEKSIEQEQEKEALQRGNIRKRPRPLKEENIDGFHMRVTSEDNADFEENMKSEIQAKRQEMELVYNHKSPSTRSLLLEHGKNSRDFQRLSYDEQRISRLDPSPLMASDEFMPNNTLRGPKQTNLFTDASSRNALFFTPNHIHQDDKHTTKSPTNPLMIINNDEATSKNIMPPPVLDPKIGESSLPSQLVPYEYKAKPTASSTEKRIVPSNTRFQYQNESTLVTHMEQNQSSLEDEYYMNGQLSSRSVSRQMSRPDVLNYDTESSNATTDLDDISISSKSIRMEREARRRKIEVERNSYVNMTPVILPGKGRDASPLLTFGTIASTPLVSSSLSSPPLPYESSKSFLIPEQDDREKMAQSAQLQLKLKSERFKSTPTSNTTSQDSKTIPIMDRHKSLTPAAQALLQSYATTSSLPRNENRSVRSTYSTSSLSTNARLKSAFASALRTSYTPKQRTKKDGHNKTSIHVNKATPMSVVKNERFEIKSSMTNKDTSVTTTNSSSGNITETTKGLLKF